MKRKTRTLGLAFAVILVISIAATSASQAAPEFQARQAVEAESEEEEAVVHATLDATQVEAEPIKFSLGVLSVTCATATATATLETASPTATFSPSFSKCKVVILGISYPTAISVGSCGFVLHATEEVEADTYKAHTDISCPGESKILITIKNPAETKTKCLIHVPPKTGLTTTKVKDMTEASPENITITGEVEGVVAVVTKGEEECLISPGTYTTGKITGNTTVTATGKGEVPPPKLRMVDKFHFADEEEEVTFIGTQNTNQEFGFDLGKVKCSQVWIEGNPQFLGKTSTELIGGEPTGGEPYEGCEFNKEKFEVDLQGCVFRIKALWIEAGQYHAGTYIEDCFVNKKIEVKSANCTITIPEQSGFKKEGLRNITLSNFGAGKNREVTANFSLSGMKYEEEGGGCKQAGKPTSNGTYSGTMRLTVGERTGPWFLGLWVEKT